MLGVDGLGGAGRGDESGKKESVYRRTLHKENFIETRLKGAKVVEGITFVKGDLLRLTPEGDLLAVKLAGNRNVLGIPCKSGSWVTFHTNGKVREAVLSKNVIINETPSDQDERVTLSEDGELEEILTTYGMLYRFGKNSAVTSLKLDPEYKKAQLKFIALQVYNLLVLGLPYAYAKMDDGFTYGLRNSLGIRGYDVVHYGPQFFLAWSLLLALPNYFFHPQLSRIFNHYERFKGRADMSRPLEISDRRRLNLRSAALRKARSQSTEEKKEASETRPRVAAQNTSAAEQGSTESSSEKETAALEEFKSEEESVEDKKRHRSSAIEATTPGADKTKSSDGGGKLNAVAAPALFSLDLLNNGHPTLAGMLLAGLSVLVSSESLFRVGLSTGLKKLVSAALLGSATLLGIGEMKAEPHKKNDADTVAITGETKEAQKNNFSKELPKKAPEDLKNRFYGKAAKQVRKVETRVSQQKPHRFLP
jgi:hypothetical protein